MLIYSVCLQLNCYKTWGNTWAWQCACHSNSLTLRHSEYKSNMNIMPAICASNFLFLKFSKHMISIHCKYFLLIFKKINTNNQIIKTLEIYSLPVIHPTSKMMVHVHRKKKFLYRFCLYNYIFLVELCKHSVCIIF